MNSKSNPCKGRMLIVAKYTMALSMVSSIPLSTHGNYDGKTNLPVAVDQHSSGWDIFSRVKFTEKFYKELNEYYLAPLLDTRIRTYEGKQITLQGYYLPLDLEDPHTIVISRNPYAACFFCGGAGPESVAEIRFQSKPPRFKADQVITVTGMLKLNDHDVNHMNFILEHAQLKSNP